LSKIGLTTTLKNAWTTSRQVNFFWVANFNLKFGSFLFLHLSYLSCLSRLSYRYRAQASTYT
ncbi:hypothetical protein, partial [Streptococcus pneumoniae]